MNAGVVAKFIDGLLTALGGYASINENEPDVLSEQASFNHIKTGSPERKYHTVFVGQFVDIIA